MNHPREKLPPLDYATPVARPRSLIPILGGICGLILGLFGAMVLGCGITALIGIMRDWKKIDGQGVFEVSVLNLIAAVCGVAAYRWIRHAIRRTDGV